VNPSQTAVECTPHSSLSQLSPSTLNACQLLKMESINLIPRNSDQVAVIWACALIMQQTVPRLMTQCTRWQQTTMDIGVVRTEWDQGRSQMRAFVTTGMNLYFQSTATKWTQQRSLSGRCLLSGRFGVIMTKVLLLISLIVLYPFAKRWWYNIARMGEMINKYTYKILGKNLGETGT
jgi:hypothetical protein